MASRAHQKADDARKEVPHPAVAPPPPAFFFIQAPPFVIDRSEAAPPHFLPRSSWRVHTTSLPYPYLTGYNSVSLISPACSPLEGAAELEAGGALMGAGLSQRAGRPDGGLDRAADG